MRDRDLIAIGREQTSGDEPVEHSVSNGVGDEGCQQRGAPYGGAVGAAMHEAEHERATRIGVGVVEGAVEGLGRLRDRTGDPTRGLVPRDSQGRSLTPDPGLDQGVGHMWKRRAAVTGVADDDLHEPRLQTEARAGGRAFDRLAQAVDRQRADRVDAATDIGADLRQSCGAVQEVTAEGHDHARSSREQLRDDGTQSVALARRQLEDRFGLVDADHIRRPALGNARTQVYRGILACCHDRDASPFGDSGKHACEHERGFPEPDAPTTTTSAPGRTRSRIASMSASLPKKASASDRVNASSPR